MKVFLNPSDRHPLPREQKMLKGHLPRVMYHHVYWYTKIRCYLLSEDLVEERKALGVDDRLLLSSLPSSF